MANARQKVLVIDDSMVALEWVRQALGDTYDVVPLEDPVAAGAAIIRERPDLVLVDLTMPTMSGDEVVVLAKKSARKGTRILLYSSIAQSELSARVTGCGADGFIQKHNDTQQFLLQIQRALSGGGPSLREAQIQVLLVNRLVAVRRFLSLVLTELPNVAIDEAQDALAAAELVGRTRYNLWIVDHTEGKDDCADIIEQLGAAHRGREAPPILVTARSLKLIALEDLRRLGVSHLLPKPVEAFTLLEAVRAALGLPPPEAPSNRRVPRLMVPVKVRFADEPDREYETHDISPQGAFIISDRMRSPNEVVKVLLRLPHLAAPVAATARVVHVRAQASSALPAGFGLSFDHSSADELIQLDGAFRLPET